MSWRFLLNRRWIGYFVLVVAFAIGCCVLAWWQLSRRAEALTEVARIEANYDAAPVALAAIIPNPATFDLNARWRPVAVTGRYLADQEVLIRNRPHNGSNGFEVITPLRTADGPVFMVDRGWVGETGNGGSAPYAPAPGGTVTVTVRLKQGEPTVGSADARGNTLGSIDLGQLAARVNQPAYTGAYGMDVHAGSSQAPVALPRPPRDEGPHLSYALQWYVFAAGAFGVLIWAARRERQLLAEPDEHPGAEPSSTRRPAPPAAPDSVAVHRIRRKRPSDADIEDAILDRA